METQAQSEVEQLLASASQGYIAPGLVELPALPDDATPGMVAVAEFFKVVLAVRRFAGLPEETPFAVDWVAGKTHLGSATVSRALRRLHDAGVIVFTGKTLPKPKTRLWRAGSAPVSAPPTQSLSDRVPGAVLEPGAVPVEREDAVGGVPVEPLVEAPDEPGVRDAVGRGAAGHLDGVAAAEGGAERDRVVAAGGVHAGAGSQSGTTWPGGKTE